MRFVLSTINANKKRFYLVQVNKSLIFLVEYSYFIGEFYGITLGLQNIEQSMSTMEYISWIILQNPTANIPSEY